MDNRVQFIENSSKKKVIAIGSGKGGVGKSLISSSLAINLARNGQVVTIVDLDLGSANLHTCLGLNPPQNGLTDFLTGRVSSFSDLAASTPLPKLTYISGLNDASNVADISQEEVEKILSGISSLPSDVVVLDLGAGTHDKTLDFFLFASTKILTMIPEPTSIENAYRFVKSAFFRQLKRHEAAGGLKGLIEKAMDHKNELGIRSPSDLIDYIRKIDPIRGETLATALRSLHLNVLVNQARTMDDRDLPHSVTSVCRQYFGLPVTPMGCLDYDNVAWQSLRSRRPLCIDYPNSPFSIQVAALAKSLVLNQPLKAVV